MTRVAAIDCGTNSVRLLVADLPTGGGPLVHLTRRMEVTRVGKGVDRTGRLSPEGLARTRDVLADYAGEVRRWGAERVRMVATSATRDAANADEFAAMVDEALGPLGTTGEVITGDEEARLSYVGAVRDLPAEVPAPYLVVDIGGGSTEFVRGVGADRHDAALSVDVGCVRITERHLRHDPPTAQEVASAQEDVAGVVDRALATVGGTGATMVGLAGSVTTIAGIALELPSYQPERIHHARITVAQVGEVADMLLGMSRDQRLALPVMHPGRADVIAAGALILRVAMARADVSSMVVSERDILDGIAWSLATGEAAS